MGTIVAATNRTIDMQKNCHASGINRSSVLAFNAHRIVEYILLLTRTRTQTHT